jgi:hypothetical protein
VRLLALLLVLLFGCTSLTWAQADSANSRCAAVVGRVLADTSIHPTRPDLAVFPAPAPKWPKDARGKPILVRLRVDTAGRADLTTLELTGTQDQKYRRRLAEALGRTQFGAGRYDGCAVPRWLTWTLTHTRG